MSDLSVLVVQKGSTRAAVPNASNVLDAVRSHADYIDAGEPFEVFVFDPESKDLVDHYVDEI